MKTLLKFLGAALAVLLLVVGGAIMLVIGAVKFKSMAAAGAYGALDVIGLICDVAFSGICLGTATGYASLAWHIATTERMVGFHE